ncbi:MAG TPA: GTP cyclohydrolase I FolE [candidate division Zixibacteria bacterium]
MRCRVGARPSPNPAKALKRAEQIPYTDRLYGPPRIDSRGTDALMALPDTIRTLLQELGENPERPGLEKTPERVAESLRFLTRGYAESLDDVIGDAVFAEDTQEMVLLRDVDFFSLCEHHLLPFYGRCHLAYIPNRKIIGLSKLARVVEVFARRLQVQERLTNEIARTIEQLLEPSGVAVVMEAEHLCMQMRGIQKVNSVAVTSCLLGSFRERPETRAELYQIIGHPYAKTT